MSGLLLDTCAVIWLAASRLPDDVTIKVRNVAASAQLYHSPISAWEIAMLGRARPEGPRIRFDPDPVTWFNQFRTAPGVRMLDLTDDIAMAAALLPSSIHSDPADRILIATARHHGVPIVTGDRRIIDYGRQGILDVLACHPQPEATP